MLSIRLARTGRRKKASYRILVSEKTKDMYGDSLENVGTYNPHTKQAVLKVERIKYWLSRGAQASSVLNNLLIRDKIIAGKKAKAVSISRKRREKIKAKKQAQAKAAATPTPTAPIAEEKTEAANEQAV